MDFAFAPTPSDYDTMSARHLRNRPDTKVLQDRKLTSVEALINFLGTDSSISRPTGDLLLVSHGNDAASMLLHLLSSQKDRTYYETAEDAASGALRLSFDVNHDGSGAPTSMQIHIRGCNIGVARPFVDKLREAFGGDTPVTAPLHSHDVYPVKGKLGTVEFLARNFTITRSAAFTTRQEVVDAFKAKNFTHLDATPIPSNRWDKWVSEKVTAGSWKGKDVFLRFGRTIGTLKGLNAITSFHHDVVPLTPQPVKLPAEPPTDPLKLEALRKTLKLAATQPGSNYADTHPFPIFKRFGFDDIDQLVDGLSWTLPWTPDTAAPNSPGIMKCKGVQHQYSAHIPITRPSDPETGKLVYNFYPEPSTGLSAVRELLTSDSELFYTA